MPASRLIKVFTSLRLTVVLLAFAIVLVFVGTVAQVDEGLYNAQSRYFRQWLVFGLDLFGHRVPLVLPGGYLIGTLLLINLLAAHIYRFEFSRKKIGIQLAHAGVILLLVGQLATDMLSEDSQMRFIAGETRSYAENSRRAELVFLFPVAPGRQQVVSIPEHRLAAGRDIQDSHLPFVIRVKQFWKNSNPSFRAPMMQNGPPLTTNGLGADFDFQPEPEVKTTDEKNVPTALIELVGPNGSLGDWIVSAWSTDTIMVEDLREFYRKQAGREMADKIIGKLTQTQSVTVNGQDVTFQLRPVRMYFPFSLTLLHLTNSFYMGSDIPHDYRSRVRLVNPQTKEDREVEIYMNTPLRYQGMTFYQQQMDASQAAAMAGRTPSSVLEVVRNPGWLTPYLGCAMVALGLVIQFMYHLTGFVSRRKSK